MGSIIVLIVIIGLAIFSCWITGKKHVDSGDVYVPTQSQSSDSEKITVSKKSPYGKILKFFLFLFVIDVIRYVYFYSTYGYHLGSPIFDFFLWAIGAGLCCLIYSYIIIPISNAAGKSTDGDLYKAIQERDGKEELLGAIEAYGNAELLDMRDKYIHSPSPSLFVELEIAFFKQIALDQNVESAYRTAGELGLSYEEITAIAKSFDSHIDDDAAHRIWEEAYSKRGEKTNN